MSRLNYGSFEAEIFEYYDVVGKSLTMIANLLLPAASYTKDSRKYYRDTIDHNLISRVRTGKRNFTDDLLEPYLDPDVRDTVIPYFDEELIPYISQVADLIRALKAIIMSDAYTADKQKEAFIELAKEETLAEFLAEVHIYVMKKRNISPKDLTFPFNNLEYSNNLNFTGREDSLKRISEILHKDKSPCTISGLGGIGKTQVALEYVYRHHLKYDVIWWINAETTESIIQSIKKFVERKGLIESGSNTDTVSAFLSWFENNANWLIVYNNVEDFDTIAPFIPKKMNGHIIATSRLTQNTLGEQIDLDLLSEFEAVEFMQNRTRINDEVNATVLAQRLGRLPLALEQAGAYIATNPRVDFIRYLSRLEESLEILKKEVKLTDYKLLITATWQISMDKIKLESAKQLLYICSYFAPEGISFEWFINEAIEIHEVGADDESAIPEPLRHELLKELDQDDIICELTKYSLVQFEDEKLYIHRLLQEVIRAEIDNDKTYVEACLDIWRGQIFNLSEHYSDEYENLYLIIFHTRKIFEYLNPLETDLAFHVPERLLLYSGNFMHNGEYQKALLLLELASEIFEKIEEYDKSEIAKRKIADIKEILES